jgi:hypothetical protein
LRMDLGALCAEANGPMACSERHAMTVTLHKRKHSRSSIVANGLRAEGPSRG